MNIYKTKLFPYIEGDSLVGRTANVTMTEVKVEEMPARNGKQEKKYVLYFEDTEKGLVLNKTNAKTIARLYGRETEGWEGQRITLYSEEVQAFGEKYNATRVAPVTPKALSSQKIDQESVVELTEATPPNITDLDKSDTGMPGTVHGGPPPPQKDKAWHPSKSGFFTRLRDDFGLTAVKSASLLKVANYTDGYDPALATEMYDAVKAAVGNGDEVSPPEATSQEVRVEVSPNEGLIPFGDEKGDYYEEAD
jgi:hypothetical protein